MKRAQFINVNYLIDHAEDIINNTDVLFPEWLWRLSRESFDGPILQDIWKRMYQKHQRESGNWYIFGRGTLGLILVKLGRKLKIVLSVSIVKPQGTGTYSSGKRLNE